MNRLLIAAFVAVAGTGVAHAQDASDSTQPMQQMQQTQPVAATPGTNDVGGSYAGSTSSGAGLTRAEVRQQLVHAESDGQLKQLDDTLYKGGQ
jgi:opacity protein-like surface antigen